MGIRQYKNKRDENEPEIVDLLKKHGFSVLRVDEPVDLIVGRKGVTYLVEVKNGPKASLTPPQSRFFETWTGHAAVLHSIPQALDFIENVKAGVE